MIVRRVPLAVAALLALALPLAACGSDDDSSSDSTDGATTADTTAGSAEAGGDVPDGPTISIGAQDFGESAILAEIYGQALEDAGYPVSQQAIGGFRDPLFTAIDSGDVNFTPEYAASTLEFLNEFAGEASSDIEDTVDKLEAQLEERSLVAFDASSAVNANAFVVTQETADELGLSKISDLTDDLRLGATPDCTENASCIPGLQSTYGLDFTDSFVSLDPGAITWAALEGGEIDVGALYSTDGIIADKGWVILEDDKGLVNADNIIPIGTLELLDAYGDDLESLVDDISGKLDTAGLTELNRRVSIDLEDANAVALDWLKENGFIE